MNVELAIAGLGCLVLAFGHTTIGLLDSGRRSQDPAAGLGCGALARCQGAGLLAGSPPSAQAPASSGAVGLAVDRGDVLDRIHLSPDLSVSTGRGRRRWLHE